MKFVLPVMLCLIGFSASAQWYRVDLILKKPYRPAFIKPIVNHSLAKIPKATVSLPPISPVSLSRSQESYDAAEILAKKTIHYNMRNKIYYDASYNFSDLAHLYIEQNRFSEAKWYLLQSNAISMQQNDDRHTISNLMDLAIVKTNVGDFSLALKDLADAHKIAVNDGYKDILKEIEQTTRLVKQRMLPPAKASVPVRKPLIIVTKRRRMTLFTSTSVI